MLNTRMQHRLVATLLIATLSGGCTTLMEKHGKGFGTPFAGTREMDCNFAMALYVFPIGLLALPFIIIDIPLSLTADILLLPFDLASDNKPQRNPCKST